MEKSPKPRGETTARESENKKGVSRRALIFGGAAALGAGALGIAGIKTVEMASEQEVDTISNFLHGEGKDARLTIGEHTYTYKEFLHLFEKISPPALPESEAGNEHLRSLIMREFGTMMQVESRFGGALNNNPAIEWIDQAIEKSGIRSPLASSFGYAQIQPGTASDVALRHGTALVREKLLSDDSLRALAHDPSDAQTVELLNLTGNESVVYGLLEFARCFHYYGKRDNTDGLVARNTEDPRGANLALAAYSGNFSSPRGAKAQTYLNELLAADPALAKAWGGSLLTVDGSRGENTKKLIELAKKQYGISVPSNPLFEGGARLRELQHVWESKTKKLFSTPTPEGIGNIKDILMRRYSTAIGTYIAARDAARGNRDIELEKSVTEKFQAFVDSRDENLFSLLCNKKPFEEAYGKNTFEFFWNKTLSSLRERVANDELYVGYVPTAFIAPRVPFLGDPGDIMHRAILSEEKDLHGSDITALQGIK